MANTTFAPGTVVTSDWLNDVNDLVYEGLHLDDVSLNSTFTGTLTGVTTTVTGTIRIEKIDKIVTIYIPTMEGTSNDTACTITGMSSSFFPVRTQTAIVPVKNNGTVVVGLAQIDTGGVITLQNGIGGGTFTGSGTKGIREISFSYLLN